MIYVKFENLQPGDVISEDLYNTSGAVLLRSGSRLSAFAIEKLKSLNLGGVYIESEFGNDIKVEGLIPNNLKSKAINDLERVNISSTVYNAKDIVSYILEAFKIKDVSLDYMDSRHANSYLFQHSISVAEISVIIGKSLGFDESMLTDLATSALLHDVGKLFADRNLIKKIGLELTKQASEYEQEMHPFYGYNLLANNSEVKATVRNGILFHHINEDKTGFPKFKVPPKDIYIFAKIIQIADAYDNVRHQDGKNNPALAVEYLKNGCDTLFNRKIVEEFLQYAPIFPISTVVTLSTGEFAIVYDQNKGFQERPKLIIASGPRKGYKIDLMDRHSLNLTIVDSALNNINNRTR